MGDVPMALIEAPKRGANAMAGRALHRQHLPERLVLRTRGMLTAMRAVGALLGLALLLAGVTSCVWLGATRAPTFRMSLETTFADPSVRALAAAARKGRIAWLDELVAQGVDVNSRGKRGVTPLFWAMKDIRGFERLLELGADPNALFRRYDFEDDTSVIHWAAKHSDTRFLRQALEHGGDPNLATVPSGRTPLFHSGYLTHNMAAARMLVDAGADVDARSEIIPDKLSDRGQSYLVAVSYGRPDATLWVLRLGTNHRARDVNGHGLLDTVLLKREPLGRGYPLGEVGRYERKELRDLQALVDWLSARGVRIIERGAVAAARPPLASGAPAAARGRGETALHLAARRGRLAELKALLAAGADPNARNGAAKETPLHFAAKRGRASALKALLAAGADPNARDRRGEAPLHWAAGEGHGPLVAALLAAGADPKAPNKHGETPLHWAVPGSWIFSGRANRNHASALRALLAAGADPNARDRLGETPLHCAAANGHVRALRALLAAGADPNAPTDMKKITPLHFAARRGHALAVKALLAAGADPEAEAVTFEFGANEKPLDLAARWGNDPTVRILLAAGADPNGVGGAPLTAAVEWGNDPTIRILLAAGADPDGLGSGEPMRWAVKGGHAPVVRALLAAGADPNLPNGPHFLFGGLQGSTPLHAASEYPVTHRGHTQAVKALLAAGADPQVRGEGGLTPLALAKKLRRRLVIEALQPGR